MKISGPTAWGVQLQFSFTRYKGVTPGQVAIRGGGPQVVHRSPMALRRRKTIWQSSTIAFISLSALTVSTPLLASEIRHFSGSYHVDAEVVRVEPIVRTVRVAVPREVCWEERVRRRWGPHHLWRHHSPGRSYITIEHRCDIRTEYRDKSRIDGYKVTYLYQGRRFTTRKDHDPGKRIRLRIRVEPAAEHERESALKKDANRRNFVCDDDCFNS